MENLIREIQDRQVIIARVHIEQGILSRRNVCVYRDRRQICRPVKAGADCRVCALILLHKLSHGAQRRSVRPHNPVALMRHIEHVVTVRIRRSEIGLIIVMPQHFRYAVGFQELHADTALQAVRSSVIERIKVILLERNAAQREIGEQVL